jgi:hypothetical protein
MIDDAERDRRLDENSGYLRERICINGESALLDLIRMPIENPKHLRRKFDSVSDELRFVADCWLDKDGDVIDPQTRKTHLLSRGISSSENRY